MLLNIGQSPLAVLPGALALGVIPCCEASSSAFLLANGESSFSVLGSIFFGKSSSVARKAIASSFSKLYFVERVAMMVSRVCAEVAIFEFVCRKLLYYAFFLVVSFSVS